MAGACQARLRRQNICQPPQARPTAPITHVDGSGTATGAVARNPETSGMLHENWKAPAESNLEINEFELSVPLLT